MTDEEKNQQENYRKEYDIVSSSWRFYIGLRFIVVGFTATLQSGLFTLYNQLVHKTELSSGRAIIIMLVGIIAVIGVGIIEWRNISLFRRMMKRGVELEQQLSLRKGHFWQLSDPYLVKPEGFQRAVTHTWGIILIYGAIATLWASLFALTLTK